MPILPLMMLAMIVHISAVMSGIILSNITLADGLAFYGGTSGFLPNDDSPYANFTRFISGDEGPEVAELGNQGGLGFFRWIIVEPMCVASGTVKVLLTMTTFNYPIIHIIPTEGVGLWVRQGINILSTLLTIGVVMKLVEFLVRSGILSNPYALVGLGLASIIGVISVLANAAGALSCG